MRKKTANMQHKKALLITNVILVILEFIALIHDVYAFGIGLFQWYTIDSNVLQLVISALVVYFCLKNKPMPDMVTILHFISAVGLTVTFLIAAFVLVPEGGIAYYFLDNVAPINHLLGPALSVISLLFLEKVPKTPVKIIVFPTAASLLYGAVCLILNATGVMDGPYFFLKVHERPASTVLLWFVIIAFLCTGLAFAYYRIKWRKTKQRGRK